MLTRRLIVARAALETISKGECAPEISKTAREALDSLDTLDGLDELKVFYRKMSAGEYEHFLAERKMAVARTALETIANGETDPGVRKLARETLDGFNVLSDGEQFKGFFIGVQQDQPIPELDPTALRQFHEKAIEQSRGASNGAAIALGALGLGQGISGEDAGPLCARNWVIGIAIMQGLLRDWQQGTELDGSVFRVAATIPVNGVQFDPESLLRALERRELLKSAVDPLSGTLFTPSGLPLAYSRRWHSSLGPLLGPIFNIVFLCRHCSYVREVVTIATKYAEILGANVFEVSFIADMANCDGMVAVGTDEQQDVHISRGWRDDDHLLASLRAPEKRGYCP